MYVDVCMLYVIFVADEHVCYACCGFYGWPWSSCNLRMGSREGFSNLEKAQVHHVYIADRLDKMSGTLHVRCLKFSNH
jgi:hypothetical protein